LAIDLVGALVGPSSTFYCKNKAGALDNARVSQRFPAWARSWPPLPIHANPYWWYEVETVVDVLTKVVQRDASDDAAQGKS